MNLFLHIVFAIGLLILAVSAMSLGQILRRKGIAHCGASSMDFNGEKIRCLGCKIDSPEKCPRLAAKNGNLQVDDHLGKA